MNESQARFIELLKQEASALADLHGLLMKELTALNDRNSEKITELAKSKNSLLNKLGVLDKQRQLYIENDEHPLYKNDTFSNNIEALSNEIQTSLDKCRHQNNINGAIIEVSQLFNEKMLDIVCGNSDEEVTYSASGKNDQKNNQRSLAHV